MKIERSGDPGRPEGAPSQAVTLQRDELRGSPARVAGRSEAASRKKKKIWFFGHFGLGNFGNESTLQAALYNLRRMLPDADMVCICTGPPGTAVTHNIATVPVSRVLVDAWHPRNRLGRLLRSIFIGIPCEIYRWLDGLSMLKPGDVFLVPGTGLVTDAYSLRGWGPYNVFKWSLIAKLRGCKLLFVSVGAGPLFGRAGRFLATSALGLADFRSYRDDTSLQYLRSIGFIKTTDRVYPDLAFSLPESIVPARANKSGRRPVVGLGVMLYAGKYADNANSTAQRNYLESLLVLVRWLLDHDYDVRLLIGDLCDLPEVAEFKSLLKERLPDHDASRIIDEPVESVEQLFAQLAGTDFVVATRFHNVLLSLFSNKPVIGISFHHKVSSLMSSMGLSDYCLDINSLKGEELIAKVRDIEQNGDQLRRLIRERAESRREELNEQYESICREVYR